MRKILLLAVVALMLGGCVVYPGYDYGYYDTGYYPYAYPYPYSYPYWYASPGVGIYFSGHGGHGFHHGYGGGFRGGRR